MKKNIVGRQKEMERLDSAMKEKEAQLIIVYGRRRVGKTYLINEYFDNRFTFQFTGAFDQTTKQQLQNFARELKLQTGEAKAVPGDWTEAFFMLREYLSSGDEKKKQIVFFDEMPWMDRQKSGFLSAFEWFWNAFGSAKKNLVFIVCGSATSWMTEKLDRNRGGLFHRQTCRLYLEPFDLHETELYFQSRDVHWSRYDIVQCYMIMGGIPYYLKLVEGKYSLSENIDRIFFRKRGELWDEFDQLYRTLFSNSERYVRIAEALATKKKGFSRNELAAAANLPPNGVLTKALSVMENAGFIRINHSFGMKRREKIYQLSDYYTRFYFQFLREHYGKDEHFWSNTTDHPARAVWSGLTFEQVCKDHIGQIKKKLGISGVMTEISSWQRGGKGDGAGAQIDLLIERRDRVINLCEIKFSAGPYEIKKNYDINLKNKVSVFREAVKTDYTIQPTIITTYGLKKNMYSNYVSKEVTMDDLFEAGDDWHS